MLWINILLKKIISHQPTGTLSFPFSLHSLFMTRNRRNRVLIRHNSIPFYYTKIDTGSCLCFWKQLCIIYSQYFRAYHDLYILTFGEQFGGIINKLILLSNHSLDILDEDPLSGSWFLISVNSVCYTSRWWFYLLLSDHKNSNIVSFLSRL